MGDDWSDDVLEEVVARATKLLSGMGGLPVVRTLMAGAGMDDDAIVEGRDLLLACLAAPVGAKAATDTDSAKAQRAAVAELDAWDEPNFTRYEATLARHAPGVGAVVFDGLKAATGDESVRGVATLLARLDGLDHASQVLPKKKGAKVGEAALAAASAFDAVPMEERNAAAKLLVQRGLTAEVRAHLAELVATALGPTEALATTPKDDGSKEQRKAALTALRKWYVEWSAAARAVVKKRGYLIRLGLAKRKPPTKPPPAEGTK